MKSVVVVSGDFVRTGGMDMANYALLRRLADRGTVSHAVAFRVDDSLAASPSVVVHRVPKPANSYLAGSFWLDAVGRSVAKRHQRVGARVIVNGGNCQVDDVNWVHYVHAAYEPQHAAGGLRTLKNAAARRLSLARERSALTRARLVLANSDRTRRDLIERLGLEPKRVRTLYYGIDPERFAPADPEERAKARAELGIERGPVVVFIGALGDRRKGFDTLYSAWSRLCERSSWDGELLVIGRGVELDQWRSRAAAQGLGARIHFLGFRSDVPTILKAADALVAPTRYEAFGLGVLEALCCGLPCIVSADAGVAEKYPESLRGLLLQDPNSADELVAKLDRWRTEQESFGSAGVEAAYSLRQRTWDIMADELLDHLA